ncbi:hypothetical protein GM661_03815 [Iocasia frigidifontis]|uniref:Uncharacterized protein n=1 Tax=Iocasia fonsfrigidae TaxID=2682810 RepID=A0A8A7KG75_9FIRM|nr:hypothetical protein [Iocasia fonsfrigidae]QTL97164.1 hypothetical protein GM661_03815 [Iocasia fonsfrigidae]
MLKYKKFIVFLIFLFGLMLLSSFTFANNLSNQKLCFISDRFGSYDLFLINGDGSNLKRLTTSDLDETNPVWSPDGKKILFLSRKGYAINDEFDLWVINADGSNIVKIDTDIRVYNSRMPKWSPDSSKILYVTDSEKRLKIYDLKNNTTLNLLDSDTEVEYPCWSLDGTMILTYLKNNKERGVYLISLNGDDKIKLFNNKGSYEIFSWAPDGSKFAYIYTKPFFSFGGKKSGMYVVDKNGKKDKFLGDAYYYEWSPDSKFIVFLKKSYTTYQDESYTHYSTYIINAEINNKKNKAQLLISITDFASFPVLSPDGMKIANKSPNKVYIRELSSGEEIEIKIPGSGLYETNPNWSLDSENLVIVGYPKLFTGDTDLFIVNYKDGQIYKLTNTEKASEDTPVWSPVFYSE